MYTGKERRKGGRGERGERDLEFADWGKQHPSHVQCHISMTNDHSHFSRQIRIQLTLLSLYHTTRELYNPTSLYSGSPLYHPTNERAE